MQLHRTPIDFTEPAGRALALTRDLIQRFGGRLAGSPACLQTAQALMVELQRTCGQAVLEPFTTRPGAFTGFYRIDAMLYLVGLALLILRQPLLAGLLLLFMVTAAGLQFGWYVEFYDRLYPPKTCQNLSAVLEPREAPLRQLIFSAHHDSANELKFLQKHQKLYGLKIVVPDFIRMLALTTAWAWTGWRALSGTDPAFVPWATALLVAGVYPVFTKFFLFEPWPVPGAGDNLIASAMLVELAGLLREPGWPGHSILAHTRLVFTSFDAEEAGLRGSRAWVKAHTAELAALPTSALNIDSIYTAAELQFLTSDLNAHITLDAPLAAHCCQIAQQAGFSAKLAVMRFGGGATDATELAKVGVRATTMLAMPTGIIRDGLVYHTMRDTVEAIQPAAVEACLAVGYGLAVEVDNEYDSNR